MTKKSDQCILVESLLIKRTAEGLGKEEEAAVKEHLDKCHSCRRYAANLICLSDSLTFMNTDKIKPRPETLVFLNDELQKSNDHVHKRSIVRFSLSKTHLYPALAAVLIAVMVIFSINTIRPVSEVVSIDSTYQQIIKLTQPAVVDFNSINQQAGGKSIKEDSLLLNYINYSM